MEQTPKTHQKTAEEISQTLEVLNLDAQLQGSELQFDPTDTAIVEQNHPEHEVFTAALRQLRRDQKAARHEETETAQKSYMNRSQNEAMAKALENAEFSPSAWRRLAPPESSGMIQFFSPEQRISAAQSHEGFITSVRSVLGKYPEAMLRSIDQYDDVLAPDQIRRFANRLAASNPTVLLKEGAKLKRYVSESEYEGLVDVAIKSLEETQFWAADAAENLATSTVELQEPAKESTHMTVTAAQQARIIEVAQKSPNFYTSDSAASLVEAGLLEPEPVIEKALEVIRDEQDINVIMVASSYGRIFKAQGRSEELRDVVIKRCMGSEVFDQNWMNMWGLDQTGILSAEDAEQIYDHFWQKAPKDMLLKSYHLVLERYDAAEWLPALQQMIADPALVKELPEYFTEELFKLAAKAEGKDMSLREVSVDLAEAHPVLAIKQFRRVRAVGRDYKDADWLPSLVRKGLDECSEYDLIDMKEWGPASGLSDEELGAAAIAIIRKDGHLGFLHITGGNEYLQELIGKERMDALVADALHGIMNDDVWVASGHIDKLNTYYGDETKTVAVLSELAKKRPLAFMGMVTDQLHRLDPDMAKELVLEALKDPDAINSGLNFNYNTVELVLGHQATREWVITVAKTSPDIVLLNWSELKASFDEQAANSIADTLVEANPAAAWLRGTLTSKWSPENIISAARADAAMTELAPAYFKDLFKRFDKASENSQRLIMKDASITYGLIHKIKQVDPDIDIASLQTGKSAREQMLTLVQLGVCSYDSFEGVTDSESLQEQAYKSLASRLGMEAFTSDQLEQINAVFVPFSMYVMQHGGEASELRPLLADMAQHMESENSLREWRLGAPGEAGLRELQAAQLLPTSVTAEQYQAWQTTDQELSMEDLVVTPADVRMQLQQIIAREAGHFDLADETLELSEAERQQLTDETAELGSQLATTNKEIAALRGIDEVESVSEGIVELEAAKQALIDQLAATRVKKILVDLWNLTDAELEAGATLTTDGKQQQTISRMLSQLRGAAIKVVHNGEVPDILDRIGGLVESFQEQNNGVERLMVEDTADLLTTFEIGAKPVGTCQHYVAGMYNECLIGYTEPNTKIITVREARGDGLLARAVVRLLEDESGEPALHVEAIYSQSASPALSRSIYEHALRKSKTLGVAVFFSAIAQNADGEKIDTVLPEGLVSTASTAQLSTKATRAPFIYADSGGGKIDDGKLELKLLRRLSRI